MNTIGRAVVAALILVYFLNISLLWRSTRKPESEAEKTRNAAASRNIGSTSR